MILNIPPSIDEKSIFKIVKDQFRIKDEGLIVEHALYFDTFDWRLYHKNYLLLLKKSTLYLQNLDENLETKPLAIQAQPGFVWDLPESDLKKQLTPIIEMRKLLQLMEIVTEQRAIGVQNKNNKTICRIFLIRAQHVHKPGQKPFARFSKIQPVRGYQKHAIRLKNILAKIGINEREDNLFLKALQAVNRSPGDYSAKMNIPITPQMRSDDAVKKILRFLVKVMRDNEDGIKNDIDTEFLHDFRVAVRRNRSALGQLKKVFLPEITERFKNDFAYLCKMTNRLRDLDVYLLDKDRYKALLPHFIRNDIDPLFINIAKERRKAFNQVKRALKSPRYNKIMNDWETFLNPKAIFSKTAANARMPIIELAKKRIIKKYRFIIHSGKQIKIDSPDQMLHSLRIECKKLKYLLEFFSSLLPIEERNRLIKQLKKLQDNLGRFNDFSLQTKSLLALAEKFSGDDSLERRNIVAIGTLVGAIDKEKQKTRSSFSKVFQNFASEESQQLFTALFDGP